MTSSLTRCVTLRLLIIEILKNRIVYCKHPNTILEWKATITQTVATIDEDILRKAYKNMKNRIFFVLTKEEGYFGHLLN